jgi:hypothetical protein
MCLTLMIAATMEVERGVENLWKRGPSLGMRDYPNYGRFIPINYFKAFLCGFPYLWADKIHWSIPSLDLQWDIILPFMGEYNAKRSAILKVLYLMLDESMSGWRPKTSKTILDVVRWHVLLSSSPQN